MAKKRLNKNLVIALTLFTCVAMIALSVLMLRQLQRRDPQYMIGVAERYEAEGSWRTAALFYEKAWLRSGDAQYLVKHGEMLLEEGDVAAALGSWRRALIKKPDLSAAHVRQLEVLLELARLYGQSSDWRRAQEAAEAFISSDAQMSTSQEAFAHNVNGLAWLNLAIRGDDNVEQGEVALVRATELAPDVVSYAVDLAMHHIRQGNIEEGERIFKELLSLHNAPGGPAARARLAYAEYLATEQRVEEAKPLFDESLTLASGDEDALREVQLGYSGFLVQRWIHASGGESTAESADALLEGAEAILQTCIEADPDDYDPYLRLAFLYRSTDRQTEVVDLCDERLKRGLSRKGIQAPRNRINAFSLMVFASQACVAEAVAALESGDQDSRERWLVRADQYVEDARGEFPSQPRLLTQSARVKLARGLDRAALEGLRAADEAYRSAGRIDWDNKITLARLHLKLNEAGAAQAVLEEVIEEARRTRSGDVAFWNLYAQILFRNDAADGALIIVERILLARPDYRDALRLKAAIYERRGRPGDAGRVLAGASADPVLRAILLAREKALDGDTEGAAAVLSEALQEMPADFRLVSAVVRQMLQLQHGQEARRVALAALAADSDSPRLKALEVITRTDLPQEDQTQAILEIIKSEKDAYQRAVELVGFHFRKQEWGEALKFVDQALQHLVAKDTKAAQSATATQHRVLLQVKLRAASALDDADAMMSARDSAARHDVDGAGGTFILGLFHMHRKEYELAAGAFAEVVEVQPTDVRAWTRLGQCLQNFGELGEARAAYQRALRINTNEGDAHWGLAVLANAGGDQETYDKELAICERLLPQDSRIQAAVLARNEAADPPSAIARRKKLLVEEPEDVKNLKQLATLYETVGDLAEADESYTRLLEIEPDNKDMVIVAGRYYRRTDRPEQALEVLNRYAQTRTSPDEKANARILIASHYLALGDTAKVESTLEAAAKLAETFEVVRSLAEYYFNSARRPDKAIGWLDKAVQYSRAEKSPKLPAMMAARISCLLDRKLNDVDLAQEYLNELRESFPDFPTAILLGSEIHARRGRISQAIDALSNYLAAKPNDAYALFQRALHHRALGRIGAAISDLETVKRGSPLALELKPRLLLARLHRQSGREDQWLRELESLGQDAPNSDKVAEELIQAYIQKEKTAEAERMVTARINRSGDEPVSRWYFLRGQISLSLGEQERAIQDYHRAARSNDFAPQDVTRVLDLYLRLLEAADGVRYYEQNAPTERLTPTLVSRYARLLILAGKEMEAVKQFRRAMSMAVLDSPGAIRNVAADLRVAYPTKEVVDAAIVRFEGQSPDRGVADVDDRILAQLFRMAGRYGEASTRLERLILASDAPAQLLQELGDTFQAAGDGERARQAYEQSLNHDGDNWITLNNLAYLLSDQLGENGQARPYAERAVAMVGSPDTLDTLGWIYVGLGEYSLAIAELSRAVRLDPNQALTFFHLGEAYRRDGEFDEAGNVLNSGRELARAEGNADLLARFDESVGRVDRSDPTP